MTFVNELDQYPLKIYLYTKSELCMSRLSKVICFIRTDIQTDVPKLLLGLPRRFAGGKMRNMIAFQSTANLRTRYRHALSLHGLSADRKCEVRTFGRSAGHQQ